MGTKYLDLGLLIIRLGIGGTFLFHGYPKLAGGTETWVFLGGAMGNLGITFAPVFWGFMAALTEFAGGILIMLGLLFRPAALLLFFTMLVAFIFHLAQGDPFQAYSHSLKLIFVFAALFFTGPGKYAVNIAGNKS